MESFFSTLKSECVTDIYSTRAQARHSIFEYIEVWYNTGGSAATQLLATQGQNHSMKSILNQVVSHLSRGNPKEQEAVNKRHLITRAVVLVLLAQLLAACDSG